MTASPPLPAGFNPNSPLIETEAIPACPTCQGKNRDFYASGHDYELETCRNEWHFWQCADCGTVWPDPRPAVRELETIYPPHYYSYQLSKTISPIALKGKDFLDRLKFAGILKHVGFEPSSFLDIGCGDGRYLKLFADRGLDKQNIFGLELSEEPVSLLRNEGYQAFHRRVEDCEEILPESIELATMFHVIEHVADPLAVVRQIGEWLTPGGVLTVETPNIDSLDRRLFGRRWWGGYHIPRHWTLFDPKSLKRLFEEAGLEVTYVGYQTGHSFWMYSLHHLLKYNSMMPLPWLAKWFDPLKGLPFLIAITGFDTIRRLLGFKTSAMLLMARKPKRARTGMS